MCALSRDNTNWAELGGDAFRDNLGKVFSYQALIREASHVAVPQNGLTPISSPAYN
jgi:hypothetical protein